MRDIFVTVLFFLLVGMSVGYDQINAHQQVLAYYQQHSFMPIMHVYFNRHFSKSKQFQNFIDVIQEAEYEVGDYCRILLTDCQYQKSEQNFACKQIKRLNENRLIIGYQPSNQFTNFGDKIMQAPPNNKIFDHHTDIYTVQEIVRFIDNLVPNFLKQISNTQEFQEFKGPRYVPKIVYATRQGQVAQVVKKLGVEFFLRFDMGYVEDLTESVVNQLEISTFPSLMVLKHNFELGKLQIFHYHSHDFSENQYSKIKNFLSLYALPQRRNDYVFHLIKPSNNPEIVTLDKSSDLDEALDKIRSWVFVEQGPSPSRLIQLKEKYGLYYEYIHFLKPQFTQSKIYLINSRSNFKYEYDQRTVHYKTMDAQDFQSNSTIWLKKDYVVVGVRESYGYLCTIVDKALFAGLVQCLIIQESSYDKVCQVMGNTFQYGFIVSGKKHSTRVQGNEIKDPAFGPTYRLLQYSTRMKVKQIIDDFIADPVKNITSNTYVQELCSEPFKKCIVYFSQKSADKTKKEYLELEAIHFINEYKTFWVDLTCNQHFYEQIQQLRESSSGLIAYHPRVGKYVYLKAKMTRNVIKKFLQINNQEKKTLPFKQFSTSRTLLNNCQKDSQIQQENKSQEQQFENNQQEQNYETQL